MLRVVKRVVNKYFGNTKNFIVWICVVIATIYVLDTFILTRERVAQFVNKDNGSGNVVHMDKQVGETKVEPAKQEIPPAAKDVPPEKPLKDGEFMCGLSEACPAGKYAYYMKSGYSRDVSPVICFNNEYIMTPEKKNGNRGLNVAVINEKTLKVEDVRTFDTYVDEGSLVRYLKMGIEDDHIVMIASQDEASTSLKDDSHTWLAQYGASKLQKLAFRDALVMIGQRGLTAGGAVEQLSVRGDNEFAEAVEISGCVSFPMGTLKKIEVKKPQVEDSNSMKKGEELANCGLKDGCGADSIPVHLFTGQGNAEGPKICVGGKYVMAIGLNDGGRGLNVAIINPDTKEVSRVGHFDTYAEDSSNLEIFLEMMKEGEIIAVVSNDDASKNLRVHAQKLFQTLGSTLIDTLQFRDVWTFVGQKGIDGHSTYEQVETRIDGGSWPNPIGKRLCIPTKLKGSQIKPDPLANSNAKRRKFCQKYDGYIDFCDAYHIDEPLVAAPLSDKALDNHDIFKVPIIIVPGLSHNALRMLLETVLMQPGIKIDQVAVMYDEKFPEPGALADLFGFKSVKLSGSTKYMYQVQKAFEAAWNTFKDAKHIIFLEEELILGPDFLSYMAQVLRIVESDDTLAGISAFNENGYVGVSTNPNLAYRVESFPGLASLIKKSFYDKHLKDKMETCCMERSWHGWEIDTNTYEMIIPDQSRVYRRPFEGLSSQADYMTELFNRERSTKLESLTKLTDVELLSYDAYEKHLDSLISSATALENTNFVDCVNDKGLGYYVPDNTGKSYVIYYEQESLTDQQTLSHLCHCFGLFNLNKYPAKGIHKGMLRFTYKGNNILLIGSASPYYKHRPESHAAIPKHT